jgi:subtilisin family serine protease
MKLSSLFARTMVLLFTLLTLFSSAQKSDFLRFKTGDVLLENNVENFIKNPNYQSLELINNSYYRIIQFAKIPTSAQKSFLKEKGIELLNYLPDNAFYASININADLNELKLNGAVSLVKVESSYKLNSVLASKKYPEWAMITNNKIEISGIYYSNISEDLIFERLKSKGVEIVIANESKVVRFRVKVSNLEEIYSQPEFYYFEEKSMPGEPEATRDVTNHRSNTLATEYNGGLKYDGTGITLMLQDNSILNQHIDYTGRFTNQNATQTGDHGEHCGGIIAAAGNLDPKGKGMANGAEVLVYSPTNTNFNSVPALVASNDLTITSKSYGDGTNAGYTALASQLDQQVRQYPQLIHVFSAGNSGSGWSTITGGHKQGKNVLACGNVTSVDGIASSSSRGPALDGRIKPDICAVGTSVYSTIDPNNYGFKTGTSMACPGVAGTLAQLYHGYKTLNGGVNPNAALIKGAVLNTADDLGNNGPDFIYGWGRINARRAYDLIENNNYLNATISQGGNNTHNIVVPSGTTQLRVMVYWSDYEGAASAAPALVNNIDMQIIDPSLTSFNPWVLNPANQGAAATTGVDNLNNMEQVTIDNPAAGSYIINVDGTAIPQGPQEYYVVYEFIQDEVVLTYPIGNEGFAPGDLEILRWDSYGNTGTFDLDYSTDNGGSWSSIATNQGSAFRYFPWTVPSTVSGEVLVRVTRGTLTSTSDAVLSIIPTPTNLSVDWVCVDSLQLSWSSVSGATGYEVSQLGIKYMDSVGVSSTNSIVLHGTNSTQIDWFSVRSLGPNNARGERAYAIEKSPGTFGCPINIDASLANLAPADNVVLLSCISSTLNVSISINNEGLNPISNIPLHYSLNGQTAVNEIYTGTIAPGGIFNYTFTNTAVPVAGNNSLLVWVDISGDGNNTNDSISSQFTYTNSVAKTIPWSDDFETLSACNTTSNCEVEICSLNNDFLNEANGIVDDIDWRTDAGGTPSGSTGPSTDFNPGLTGGKYLYLEASGGCTAKVASLVSPCIDLVSVANPILSFAYNMNGSDMGSLHLDIFVNGAWVNDITTTVNGDQGASWITRSVSLTPYIGSVVNFRWRGITGNGYRSDIALDDIQVAGTSTVGVEELESNFDFEIYPNPSNGVFNYTYSGKKALDIELYDVNGRVVYSQNIAATSSLKQEVIDIRKYSDGVYMLVLTKGSERITKRVVKK